MIGKGVVGGKVKNGERARANETNALYGKSGTSLGEVLGGVREGTGGGYFQVPYT